MEQDREGLINFINLKIGVSMSFGMKKPERCYKEMLEIIEKVEVLEKENKVCKDELARNIDDVSKEIIESQEKKITELQAQIKSLEDKLRKAHKDNDRQDCTLFAVQSQKIKELEEENKKLKHRMCKINEDYINGQYVINELQKTVDLVESVELPEVDTTNFFCKCKYPVKKEHYAVCQACGKGLREFNAVQIYADKIKLYIAKIHKEHADENENLKSQVKELEEENVEYSEINNKLRALIHDNNFKIEGLQKTAEEIEKWKQEQERLLTEIDRLALGWRTAESQVKHLEGLLDIGKVRKSVNDVWDKMPLRCNKPNDCVIEEIVQAITGKQES